MPGIETYPWATSDTAESNSLGSTVTFEDTNIAGRSLVESNLQIPGSALSPALTMDWNQALFGRAQPSLQALLQEDWCSRQILLHEPPMDSKLTQTSSFTPFNNFKLIPDSCGYPTIQLQGLFESDTDLHGPMNDTLSKEYKTSVQEISKFCNQWQHSKAMPTSKTAAATASKVKELFCSAAPAQFNTLTTSQQNNCSNHINKCNASGVPNSSSSSVRKGESCEPLLKKPRIDMPSTLPIFKVRKEKLVDRITALQQLVSPFGKTDTASVLHETIDHIKLLHDQVSALSNTYTKNVYPMHHQQYKDGLGPEEDLRSHGLCLVPIASTYPVMSQTSPDLWTSAYRGFYMY